MIRKSIALTETQMAATVTSPNTAIDTPDLPLFLESIPVIDLRFFSQSELNSLSHCSSVSFDLTNCDEVVVPKIDRSVFNESAGSRKQTYSRLRLAQKSDSPTVGHRRGRAALHPPPPILIDDAEKQENQNIVSVLRDLFAKSNGNDTLGLGFSGADSAVATLMHLGNHPSNGNEKSIDNTRSSVVSPKGSRSIPKIYEVVNQKGHVIDIAVLAKIAHPFNEELGRRTTGLETMPEFQMYLTNLEGKWASRRKKRKIVEASDFGDFLPNGWKLLLAIKSKEGHPCIYCRRYISPNGEQFVSCKEVSTRLLPFIQPQKPYPLDHSNEGSGKNYNFSSSIAGSIHNEPICTKPISAISVSYDKQTALFNSTSSSNAGIENHHKCGKCGLTFNDQGAYIQHLSLFHKRKSRRHKHGTSISDGVIIKDGKFECQFCHKVFNERHRYNGHVGVHARLYAKSLEMVSRETLEKKIDSSLIEAPAVTPEIVASIDIVIDTDRISITETSIKSNYEQFVSSYASQNKENNKILENSSNPNLSKEANHVNDAMDFEDTSCVDSVNQMCNNGETRIYEEPDTNNLIQNLEKKDNLVCQSDYTVKTSVGDAVNVNHRNKHMFKGIEKSQETKSTIQSDENCQEMFGGGSKLVTELEEDAGTSKNEIHEEGFEIHNMEVEPSMRLLSSECFTMVSPMEEVDQFDINQKMDHMSDFEEMKFEDIEASKFEYHVDDDSNQLSTIPMDLTYSTEIDQSFHPSTHFQWDSVLPSPVTGQALSTVCVWCGVEFNLEGINLEADSDSVGFMCPACKSRISGQLNALDNGLSLNPDDL